MVWPIIAALGSMFGGAAAGTGAAAGAGAAGAAGGLGGAASGVGGLGGMASSLMGGMGDASGMMMGGGDNAYGGLISDMNGGPSPGQGPEGAGFMEKLMGGGKMAPPGPQSKGQDMSSFASLPSLLAMSNQMNRQQKSQANINDLRQHPYIQSLLGG